MFTKVDKNLLKSKDLKLVIIGSDKSNLNVLQVRKNIVYVGTQADCCYVASIIAESANGRNLPLFLDRRYAPCAERDAVVSIEPYYNVYSASALYKVKPQYTSDLCDCLGLMLKSHSPYSIAVFGDRKVVFDRRTNAGVCIDYSKGIKILCEGSFGECYSMCNEEYNSISLIGQYCMADDEKWHWDVWGKVSDAECSTQDPEGILRSIDDRPGVLGLSGHSEYLYREALKSGEPRKYIQRERLKARSVYGAIRRAMPDSVNKAYDIIIMHLAG